MTVPYCTPDVGASLEACLAAAELIDQYLGGQTLTWQAETLRLRAFQIDRDTRYTLALPRRPIAEASGTGLAVERTLAADGAPYPPIGRITAQRADAGTVKVGAIWGWPEPDRGDTRTIDLTALIDGDNVDSGTAVKEEIDTSAGECWWIYEPGADPDQWHCETAYIDADGALVRYAEASGGNYALGAGAKAQRIVWPEGLATAAASASRRLEQLKKSPGFGGYDTAQAQAVLHQITRSLDRYRPI
ncbi:MAG: hypothetical protein F4Y61_08795 [Rhodothermaceae bacterium]|nr:hypothetical protein [Rhodothermaceae bacterium]